MSDFSRLSNLLQESVGEASYDLDFSRNQQGQTIVSGRICAKVMLECQRCGQQVAVELDLKPQLMVALSDEQAKHVPKAYEPLMVGAGPLKLVDLLEEELLLAMPMVPRHLEGQCPVNLPEYLN